MGASLPLILCDLYCCEPKYSNMDDLSDGQFSFTEIYAYLPCGRYPSGYSKRDKPKEVPKEVP